MKQISLEDTRLITNFTLTKVTEKERKIIEQQKKTFTLSDNNDPSYFRWPGYNFSNLDAAKAYKRIFDRFEKENIHVPPRGNLSKSNNYVFLGIKPGMSFPDIKEANMAFLGPSGRILSKFLQEENIYPYITNVFKSPYANDNADMKFIFEELIVIFYIYEKIYSQKHLNLVFMGNYKEYGKLVNQLFDHKIFTNNFTLSVDCFSIWHPGYLARSYSEEKKEAWKKQLNSKERKVGKGKINEKKESDHKTKSII